ncbi:MAG: HlyC/CorC family transporter [Candidatus Eisenbacteria sp.]|nr:HlyC/CorC family transporter [Candidatus Eisenbacteria bacterium]
MDIVALVVLLLLSGFFSGSEAAFLSLGRLQIRNRVEQGEKKAVRIARMLENLERFLGTILVGNTLVNVALSAIATGIAIRHFGTTQGITIATVAVTIVLLVVGELTPKTLATGKPRGFAYAVIYPLEGVTVILRPFVAVVRVLAWPFMRAVGASGSGVGPLVTEEDLKMMFHVGQEEGVLEEHEKRMLRSVIEFEDTTVKEVMVPRLDIVGLPQDASFDQVVDLAVSKGYSRMPVYGENLDHIVGIAHVKDLLTLVKDRRIIRLPDMVRKPYFVPETKKIGRLLREFQLEKTHMAIVVDEFGAVAGLVTLEDLVEEIVGEIQDEYDEEEKAVVSLPDGTMRVQARMDLDDFNDLFGVTLPEGDYDTIGGFVISLWGRLPTVGEEISYENFNFSAAEVDGPRLLKILVTRYGREDEEESQEDT